MTRIREEKDNTDTSPKREKVSWRRQWMGVFAGGVMGFGLSVLIPPLAEKFSTFTIVIWCAVLGGILSSLEGFRRAGAALTRSENRWLNLLVGLGIPIVIIVIFGLFLIILRE